MLTQSPTRVPQCNTFANDTVPFEDGFKSFSVQVPNFNKEDEVSYNLVQVTGGADVNRGPVEPNANPIFTREPEDSVFRVDASADVEFQVVTYEVRLTTTPGQTAP